MAAIHLKLNILTYFLIGYKQVIAQCKKPTAQTAHLVFCRHKSQR